MTSHTSDSTRSTHAPSSAASASPSPSSPARGWMIAGVGAALMSIAGLVISSGIDAVYADASKNNPERIADAILGSAGKAAIFHSATAIGALLLVVFAAGLRVFLARRTPETSILPQVASTGLILTAVVQIAGTSLDTEFTQGARGNVTAGAITFYGHWVNTVPWYWAGAGLAGLAVAAAALRHAALPRWMALVSLALGAATTLFAVSPLEYMAAMSGALWLLIITIGLLTARSIHAPATH